jgi:hypothetical protein
MGWVVSTFDNKYQIIYGSNTKDTKSYYNRTDDVSYLTITDTKHIGINNDKPNSNYLLDINGITHINSNLYINGNIYISDNEFINSNLYISSNVHVGNIIYTSNIIGIGINNSNNLKINYTFPNFSNNSVQIYGNTTFNGKIYIENQTSNSFPLLDINGYIKATRIYGDGSNIFNMNASNITNGILATQNGGTGINNIRVGELLYGGTINNIVQNSSLKYNGSVLSAPNFDGSMNADNIINGKVRVTRGGTGLQNITQGLIPFGDGENDMRISDDLKFDLSSKKFQINTLEIANKIIYIKEPGIVTRPLHYNDIGIYDASIIQNQKGLILPSATDFTINNEGKLALVTTENVIWNYNNTGSNIFFPNDVKLGRDQCSVGINKRDPKFTLDVHGDINTSNGIFRIEGIDIKEVIKDYAIDTLRLDDLQGNNVRAMRFNPSGLNDGKGIWKVDKVGEAITLSVDNFISTDKTNLNTILINNTATNSVATDDITNVLKIEDNLIGLFKFTKSGNMLIGNNDTANNQNVPPSQRLEVIGNIHASGYIRSYYSDDRLKTLTSNITGALNIIDSLKGFHYVPNEKALELGFVYDNEIGLSAQDVRKVVPEIVKIAPFDSIKDVESGNTISKSGEEYLTICYERLGAIFVEAIKELRQENKNLKNEINFIKKDLDNIKRIIYVN